MRKLLLLLIALPAFAVPPIVSNVTATYVSHSTVLITWDTSGAYNQAKITYDIAPNACDHVGTAITQPSPGTGVTWFTSKMQLVLAGLHANTTYNVCPEPSNDGGGTWAAPVPVQFTTSVLPTVHPELPIPPQVLNTDYPSVVGYHARHLDATCTESGTGESLTQVIRDELFAQAVGAVIDIDPAAICIPTPTFTFDAPAVDHVQFQPSDITVANPGTIHSVAHGLHELDPIIFGKQYGSLSSFPTGVSCEFNQGLLEGQTYFVHVTGVTSPLDNFQVFCPDKTTLMNFASQGSATAYFEWITLPRRMNWIIIRSSAPDSMLPPEHTRLTPAWKSQMPTLLYPASEVLSNNPFMFFGDGDHNDMQMVGNIRFVGIRFSLEVAAMFSQTSDPPPYQRLMAMQNWNTTITLDRCWWDVPDAPLRVGAAGNGITPWEWDGNRMAIVDSTLGPFTYFRPTYSGLNATLVNTTHATIASGAFHTGSSVITLPSTETITFSGSPSGGNNHGHIYFDMLASNAFTVATPVGVSATCSPNACASVVSGSNNGACNNTDTWPKNGYGAVTVAPIACFDFSGSSLIGLGNADVQTSAFVVTDAVSLMASTQGSGPWKFENNDLSGVGLVWHHADDVASQGMWIRGDYYYKHNYIHAPFKYMDASPLSNGLDYIHRQSIEWKDGRRIGLYGNVFDGGWAYVDTVSGSGPTFTSVNGIGITDIDMLYNTFIHTGNALQGPATVTGGGRNTPAVLRFRHKNSLIVDINTLGPSPGNIDGSTTNYWVQAGFVHSANGWLQQGPTGTADHRLEHITVVGGNGNSPQIFRPFGVNTEGMLMANNFLGFMWNVSQGMVEEPGSVPSSICSGLKGEAAANCYFTGSTPYVMTTNVIQGGDMNQSQLMTAWPIHPNIFPAVQTIADIKFVNPAQDGTGDFNLRWDSTYKHRATDGLDIGAAISDLNAQQGQVYGITVPPDSLSATSAHVTFVAPDSFACGVRVATTAWSPTVPTSGVLPFTDSGAVAGHRDVTLTGLASNTTYYGKIFCQVQQPEFQFRTRATVGILLQTLSGCATAGSGGNDTTCIQSAFNSTAGASQILEMPVASSGFYNSNSLTAPSNLHLVMDAGASIKVVTGITAGVPIITGDNNSNITITGTPGSSLILGRKAEYTTDENRHCIRFAGSTNVLIDGISCNESGGDGIYIGEGTRGYAQNIEVRNSTFNHNSRNAMSIISCNICNIHDSTFSNTIGENGAASGGPWAGIDIEPNVNTNRLVNITLTNLTFSGNGLSTDHGASNGNGLTVHFDLLDSVSTPAPVSITGTNLTSVNNVNTGFHVTNEHDTPGVLGPSGSITITNSHATGNGKYGTMAFFYDAGGPVFSYTNSTNNNNCATAGLCSAADNADLAIERGGGAGNNMGGVHYTGDSITSTNGHLNVYFGVEDNSAIGLANITIGSFGTLSGRTGSTNGVLNGTGVASVSIP